jgi:hypothetical protein
MALSDILTVPFLISLGITLLLVGVVGFFFAQRLQEQNHKITSMFGLVTTMAEEMNFMRGRLQMMSYQGPLSSNPMAQQQQQKSFGDLEEENLIPVSDDDLDDDSDDEDQEDESDDEEDEDEDEEEEDVLEPEIIELSHDPNGAVKVINFAEMLQAADDLEDNDNNYEDLNELDDIEDLDDDSVNSEQNGSVESEENQEENKNNNSDLEFIKTIDISNLEESGEKNTIDYKKMSLNRLKEIALAKGLIGENSKATKNAILKLLGYE